MNVGEPLEAAAPGRSSGNLLDPFGKNTHITWISNSVTSAQFSKHHTFTKPLSKRCLTLNKLSAIERDDQLSDD